MRWHHERRTKAAAYRRRATSDQRLEVIDCLIDTIAVATMARTAMSDGQELDAQEITDLLSHLYEIEQDAILVAEELAK